MLTGKPKPGDWIKLSPHFRDICDIPMKVYMHDNKLCVNFKGNSTRKYSLLDIPEAWEHFDPVFPYPSDWWE